MSKKKIAAGHVRRLRTMRKNLLQMAEQWADVDEYNITQLSELADHTETVAIELLTSGEEGASSVADEGAV